MVASAGTYPALTSLMTFWPLQQLAPKKSELALGVRITIVILFMSFLFRNALEGMERGALHAENRFEENQESIPPSLLRISMMKISGPWEDGLSSGATTRWLFLCCGTLVQR